MSSAQVFFGEDYPTQFPSMPSQILKIFYNLASQSINKLPIYNLISHFIKVIC